MGRHDIGGHMSRMWCCLDCRWKGTAGTMDVEDTDEMFSLRCPRCGGQHVHPIMGEVVYLDHYVGWIGTLH